MAINERELCLVDTITELRIAYKELEKAHESLLTKYRQKCIWYEEDEEKIDRLEDENEELKNQNNKLAYEIEQYKAENEKIEMQLLELSQAKVTGSLTTDTAAKGEL